MDTTKKIIVLSDGTGNAASKVWRTNVWRVFESLDLTGPEQVARYDDGIGSSSFKPFALLAGMFGWGLKRNVIDLYKFVCRNYQPGAKIYAFGFSRGAFTVRVLIALILQQGLVPYNDPSALPISESDLHARARDAYRAFRAENFHSFFHVERKFRELRDVFFRILNWLTDRTPYDSRNNTTVDSIEFIGIWDTVAAYGLPIDEMRRGVSQWIWPLELPERTLDPRVRRACHALALDDERTTFHPVLWTEDGENPAAPDSKGRTWLKDERISQLWFVGAHSNVGGGYPDDALANLSLHWIMEEALFRGLVFKAAPKADPDALRKVVSARDKDGRQYDSRSGLGGYYRYGPRKIAELCNMHFSGRKGDAVRVPLPKIHESALARMRSNGNAYAPIGLPAKYAVITMDTTGHYYQNDLNPYETPDEAAARAGIPERKLIGEQEKVWNLVWLRRIVYFMTLAASVHVAAFWMFPSFDDGESGEFTTKIRFVSEFIRFVESFLPYRVVHWWTDYYAAHPEWFLGGVVAVAILIWAGSKLGERINDSMRVIWRARAKHSTIENSPLHMAMYRTRTNWIYQGIVGVAKNYVIPFASALLLVWLGVTGAGHLLFNIADSAGLFCAETGKAKPLAEGKQVNLSFSPSNPCFPTKVLVDRGQQYEVIINVSNESKWKNDKFPTDPRGYRTAQSDWWSIFPSYAAMPLRRVIFRRWFTVIARIGATGSYEDFLDPRVSDEPNVFCGVTEVTKRRGELFLYVNDAIIPVPWISNIFYGDNVGGANIVIKRVDPALETRTGLRCTGNIGQLVEARSLGVVE